MAYIRIIAFQLLQAVSLTVTNIIGLADANYVKNTSLPLKSYFISSYKERKNMNTELQICALQLELIAERFDNKKEDWTDTDSAILAHIDAAIANIKKAQIIVVESRQFTN